MSRSLLTYIEKGTLFSFFLLSFTIPISRKHVPLAIALYLLFWLLEGNFYKRFKCINLSSKANWAILYLVLFYILHLISLLYTQNIDKGFFDIQVKLSFFLLPLTISISSEYFKVKAKDVLVWMVAGSIVSVLFNLAIALYYSFSCFKTGEIHFSVHPNGEWWNNYFLYTYFSRLVHPSYYSLYLCFAILIVIYYLRIGAIRLFSVRFIFSFLVLSSGVFLSSSRAGIVSYILMMVLISFFYLRKKKKLFLVPIIIIVSLIGFYVVSRLNYRFDSQVKHAYDSLTTHQKSIKEKDDRIAIWQESFGLLSESIIFGIGPGDIRHELEDAFVLHGNQSIAQRQFNCHNQFLETALGIGVIGLLLMLLMLFQFYRVTGWLGKAFVVLVLFNLMFESMFNTIAGVSFFALYFSAFLCIDFDLSHDSLF